jgi:uncharacterized membrane protein YjjB (DUF3815 family)
MLHLLTEFILAMFATAGFSLIFRVPIRHIPACVIIGACGWVTYEISMYYYASPSIGCFFGACNVGLLSTIASRMFKDASTIFVIPGILCLVPGSAIFNTMAALLRDDFSSAMDVGMQTLLMAGAIAFGLLVIGAVIRVFFALMRKTVTLRDKF